MAEGNFFTNKLGPLPMYAWIGIGVAGLLVYDKFKTTKATGSNPNTSSAGPNLQAPPVTLIQEGFQGPPNNQGPVPTQGRVATTPFAGKQYTVQPGDTISSIMTQFYGSGSNAVNMRLINDANPGLPLWNGTTNKEVTPPPGTVLNIPVNGVAGYQPNTLQNWSNLQLPQATS